MTAPRTLAPTPHTMRDLGEAINSLVDNAKHWNRDTLQEHIWTISRHHIAARKKHDELVVREAALLEACRAALPWVECEDLIRGGGACASSSTPCGGCKAIIGLSEAIALAEGGAL